MRVEEQFEPDPSSARQARRFVRVSLQRYGLDSDAAEQVVSELVANVGQHARTPVSVVIEVDQAVRIEVRDGNSVIPAVVDAAADAERGRGLAIVQALSSRWGITATAEGKSVWAELEA